MNITQIALCRRPFFNLLVKESHIESCGSSTNQSYTNKFGIIPHDCNEENSYLNFLNLLFKNLRVDIIESVCAESDEALTDNYSIFNIEIESTLGFPQQTSTHHHLHIKLNEKYEKSLKVAKSLNSEIEDPILFLTQIFKHIDINTEVIQEIIDEPYG